MARPYVKTKDRKKQIVDRTVRLVAAYGVQGATLNRIAAEVGITTAGLYGHFPTRRAILVEAMDAVFERIRELNRSSTHPNALERLREIGARHTTMVSAAGPLDVFPAAMVEFIAAPPYENLREEVGARQLELVNMLAGIAEEGRKQGTIRENVDPYQVAWKIVSLAWTENISHLMGIAQQFAGDRSSRMLADIIDSIAAPGAPAAP